MLTSKTKPWSQSKLLPELVRNFEIKRWRAGAVERVLDSVALEEPLSIRLRFWRKQALFTENLAVTMRTPGHDSALAAGLLLTEGIIHTRSDLVDMHPLGIDPSNEILVELAQHIDFDEWRSRRSGFVSSSCGVCGKANIAEVVQQLPAPLISKWRVSPELIQLLPALLENQQTAFLQTGGLHAAALVDLDGRLQCTAEDIGRHNALDKILGYALLENRLPLDRHLVFLSSRGSFELVQKAAMTGVQILAAVGSPSSLAVETARRIGMTLIGFVRGERFNVYSGDWRLHL